MDELDLGARLPECAAVELLAVVVVVLVVPVPKLFSSVVVGVLFHIELFCTVVSTTAEAAVEDNGRPRFPRVPAPISVGAMCVVIDVLGSPHRYLVVFVAKDVSLREEFDNMLVSEFNSSPNGFFWVESKFGNRRLNEGRYDNPSC